MARIIEERVMTSHLDSARQALSTAKSYQKTYEETQKGMFRQMVLSFVQRAEEQIAMAELYIVEED